MWFFFLDPITISFINKSPYRFDQKSIKLVINQYAILVFYCLRIFIWNVCNYESRYVNNQKDVHLYKKIIIMKCLCCLTWKKAIAKNVRYYGYLLECYKKKLSTIFFWGGGFPFRMCVPLLSIFIVFLCFLKKSYFYDILFL